MGSAEPQPASASATAAISRTALPAARPAIAGGLALVLMEVLADFGVAEYFAIPTFSTGIFRSWLAMGDKAAALGIVPPRAPMVRMSTTADWASLSERDKLYHFVLACDQPNPVLIIRSPTETKAIQQFLGYKVMQKHLGILQFNQQVQVYQLPEHLLIIQLLTQQV